MGNTGASGDVYDFHDSDSELEKISKTAEERAAKITKTDAMFPVVKFENSQNDKSEKCKL